MQSKRSGAYLTAGILMIGLILGILYSSLILIHVPIVAGLVILGGYLHFLFFRHHRQTETSLKESEQRYRMLTEFTRDFIFVIDSQGITQYVNSVTAARFGCRPEDLIGKNRTALFPPEMYEKQQRSMKQVFDTGQPCSVEDQISDDLWIDTLLAPVRNDRGEITAVMGISRDITEQKQTQETRRENEARLRDLMESLPEVIFETDLHGNFTYANETAFQVFGYDREDLKKGINVMQTVVAEERARATLNFARILKGEKFPANEYKACRKDGSTFDAAIQSIAIFRDHQPMGIRGFVLDITRQKNAEKVQEKVREELERLVTERTRELTKSYTSLKQEIAERNRVEEALRESENKYRNIVENTLEIIMLTQPEGYSSYVSPSCREVLGYDPEELIGHAPDIFHPDDINIVQSCIKRSMNGESGTNMEYRVRAKTGEYKWVSHSWKPVFSDHKLKTIINVFRDITDRKRTEEMLQQTEKLAATGRMAARIAHEINNPLAGIKNSFQLIKTAVSPSHPYYQYVGMIEKEINRIAQIIRQMFDLYRPDQDVPEPFNLVESIQDVIVLLEPIYREANVTLNADTSGLAASIGISEDLIRQILYNLLKNAIEASPPNGQVKIIAHQTDDTLTLSVCDHGPGISDQARSRIFEPFFTTKTGLKTGGLGLGLSITKSIVETLRGSIQFQNQEGQGTVFTVTLPLFSKKREVKNV